MTEEHSFADHVRTRYPEGLTGIIAVGGTRVAYILERNRRKEDPGQIEEMQDYANQTLSLLRNIINYYFELGGQNLIIPVLSYQLFESERGAEYAETTAKLCYELVNNSWSDFYQEAGIDPFFVGIDTLLHLPEAHFAHQVAAKLNNYNQTWPYQAGRRKLIWEIAPIPLFSFWQAREVIDEITTKEFQKALMDAPDMTTMHDLLYRYYARAVYGTELPTPHFYLGTNRNGDLKLRSLLPIAMLCGGPFRLFYTPYPTLFITYETLQAVLEDLAFGKPLRSTTMDYTGQYTSELVEAEYRRVLQLSADPESTIGLTRKIPYSDGA